MTIYDHRHLDPLIHSRIRLSVLSVLIGVEDAEFTYLREQVKTTDGNLGAHLRKLERAGYVLVSRIFVDRRPITRYRLAEKGRVALGDYVDSLERLLHSSPLDAHRREAG